MPRVDCTSPKLRRPHRRRRRGAAGSAAGATTEATDAGAAGGSRNDPGIDAAHGATRRGAQNVHLRDGQVIASDNKVEIVFKGKVNGVLKGQVELAVAHQRIKARRVGQAGRSYELPR